MLVHHQGALEEQYFDECTQKLYAKLRHKNEISLLRRIFLLGVKTGFCLVGKDTLDPS